MQVFRQSAGHISHGSCCGHQWQGLYSAFIASTLRETGAQVALYTSPHLVAFNERIRVNGVSISDEQLVDYARAMRSKVDQLHATFFEATTAMAFYYFAECGADAAVVETGLGGRLDATNVVTPVLSVITSIGLHHIEHLGGTVEAIASKSGHHQTSRALRYRCATGDGSRRAQH